MKFLHTGDWHLGAKTNGRDRLSEQKRTIDEIDTPHKKAIAFFLKNFIILLIHFIF